MNAIIGGVVIGVSATIMLLFLGRVTGISGIAGSLLKANTPDKGWRLLFLLGLISGGVILRFIYPDSFTLISHANTFDYVFAGLLVGVGTAMGSGCTSGHGVCGISRMSVRSIVATLVFIGTGILSVVIFRMVRGEL